MRKKILSFEWNANHIHYDFVFFYDICFFSFLQSSFNRNQTGHIRSLSCFLIKKCFENNMKQWKNKFNRLYIYMYVSIEYKIDQLSSWISYYFRNAYWLLMFSLHWCVTSSWTLHIIRYMFIYLGRIWGFSWWNGPRPLLKHVSKAVM